MLTRLSIENFRSLEAFEFRPPSGMSVLIGVNGSGKSSIGVVLDAVRRLLVDAAPVKECFTSDMLCRWSGNHAIRVELDFEGEQGAFQYELEIMFDSHSMTPSITRERVSHASKVLYEFEFSVGRLLGAAPAVQFPFAADRSYLGIVEEQTARTTLMGFPELVRRMRTYKLEPSLALARAASEQPFLSRNGSNFSSWFRWFAQNRLDRVRGYFSALETVLPGFLALRAEDAGSSVKELKILMKGPRGQLTYSVDELSDGQRQLLMLYLILHAVEPGDVLLLDEPDNFISIDEVQPWLAELELALEQTGAQALIVSHGSEAMDYLASRNAFIFERPSGGATTVRPHDALDGRPSEVVLFGTVGQEAAR